LVWFFLFVFYLYFYFYCCILFNFVLVLVTFLCFINWISTTLFSKLLLRNMLQRLLVYLYLVSRPGLSPLSTQQRNELADLQKRLLAEGQTQLCQHQRELATLLNQQASERSTLQTSLGILVAAPNLVARSTSKRLHSHSRSASANKRPISDHPLDLRKRAAFTRTFTIQHEHGDCAAAPLASLAILPLPVIIPVLLATIFTPLLSLDLGATTTCSPEDSSTAFNTPNSSSATQSLPARVLDSLRQLMREFAIDDVDSTTANAERVQRTDEVIAATTQTHLGLVVMRDHLKGLYEIFYLLLKFVLFWLHSSFFFYLVCAPSCYFVVLFFSISVYSLLSINSFLFFF